MPPLLRRLRLLNIVDARVQLSPDGVGWNQFAALGGFDAFAKIGF